MLLAREEFIKNNLQSIDLNTPHLPMLGLEMLTYLFQVSLSSLFSEITGDMPVNLVDAGHLKIEHAVSIVKQIPEG